MKSRHPAQAAMWKSAVLLDVNVLRRPELLESAAEWCEHCGGSMLLCNRIAHEFSRKGDPRRTWGQTGKFLAPHSQRIVVARDVLDLMAEEARTGKPAAQFANVAVTEFLREHLRCGPDSMEALADRGAEVARTMGVVDGEAIKRMFGSITKLLEEQLKEDLLSRLRKDPEEAAGLLLESPPIRRIVGCYCVDCEPDAHTVRHRLALIDGPSCTRAWWSTIVLSAAEWLAWGGLESRRPEKFENDMGDLEYIALGALAERLMTEDKRVHRLSGALKKRMGRPLV